MQVLIFTRGRSAVSTALKTTQINRVIPKFKSLATSEMVVDNGSLKNQWTVIYFYPRDNTPGCTTESADFASNHDAFNSLQATIYGVSRDTMKSHEKFKEKLQLPFELISDPDETLCELFDVMKLKNMYGKQVRGIERSTFIINPQGKLVHEWRKVRVPGHVDAVLETLQSLQQA